MVDLSGASNVGNAQAFQNAQRNDNAQPARGLAPGDTIVLRGVRMAPADQPPLERSVSGFARAVSRFIGNVAGNIMSTMRPSTVTLTVLAVQNQPLNGIGNPPGGDDGVQPTPPNGYQNNGEGHVPRVPANHVRFERPASMESIMTDASGDTDTTVDIADELDNPLARNAERDGTRLSNFDVELEMLEYDDAPPNPATNRPVSVLAQPPAVDPDVAQLDAIVAAHTPAPAAAVDPDVAQLDAIVAAHTPRTEATVSEAEIDEEIAMPAGPSTSGTPSVLGDP